MYLSGEIYTVNYLVQLVPAQKWRLFFMRPPGIPDGMRTRHASRERDKMNGAPSGAPSLFNFAQNPGDHQKLSLVLPQRADGLLK